jgi:Restriction endonuclease NaeI
MLLNMDPTTCDAIFMARSGQERVNDLFRHVQDELVRRPTVLTVAQQDDAPKRVRDARPKLRPEGTIILGHQGSHPKIARLLGLPIPEKGEWVATRLVSVLPDDPRGKVYLGARYWARALSNEGGTAAPAIPTTLPRQP